MTLPQLSCCIGSLTTGIAIVAFGYANYNVGAACSMCSIHSLLIAIVYQIKE